jgi:hypothetical protein
MLARFGAALLLLALSVAAGASADPTTRIRPYGGSGPLVFGMSPAQVHAVIGEQPRSTGVTKTGERDEDYPSLSACYAKDSDVLVWLALTSALDVCFQDMNLFTTPDVVARLAEADGAPLAGLGFTVFKNLGIALADFDSDQESDRVVQLFQRGRWDGIKSLVPFAAP